MIYIIDDDPYVRRGFGMLFKSAGLEYTSFESAEGFLGGFQPGENDMIILDIHMPGMNGCDLMETMTQKRWNPPVIVVTAYDEPFSRECAKKYGALAYLRKPIDGEVLIDLIKYSLNLV